MCPCLKPKCMCAALAARAKGSHLSKGGCGPKGSRFNRGRSWLVGMCCRLSQRHKACTHLAKGGCGPESGRAGSSKGGEGWLRGPEGRRRPKQTTSGAECRRRGWPPKACKARDWIRRSACEAPTGPQHVQCNAVHWLVLLEACAALSSKSVRLERSCWQRDAAEAAGAAGLAGSDVYVTALAAGPKMMQPQRRIVRCCIGSVVPSKPTGFVPAVGKRKQGRA